MLHYSGDITGMQLALLARHYIWMYHKPGDEEVRVPFIDLVKRKRRYVKFVKDSNITEWIFIDLVD